MNQSELFVKMSLHSWNTQISRAEKVFSSYSEEEFYKEVAPGKNRIIYLFGHLIAIHDLLKETLGLGTRTYPELTPFFVQTPDAKDAAMPSVKELKECWKNVHEELAALFEVLPAEEWFTRHSAMTDEDFELDPTRNKLNVVLSRTSHVAYHMGQVKLVTPAN